MKFTANYLAHASGGLRYHLRALRYRRTQWAPFREALARWLANWQPPCRRRLLLVGPSGGHTLPADFLGRFEDVVALEPDPLARLILKRRQAGARLRFESLDCLSSSDGMDALSTRFGDRAVLFCNVLGQIDCPDPSGWRHLLATRLSGCHWASWHDVISTDRRPARTNPVDFEGAQSLERVLARFWEGGELPLIDHETLAMGGGVPHSYAIWPLTPMAHHLIEWCAHAPDRVAD